MATYPIRRPNVLANHHQPKVTRLNGGGFATFESAERFRQMHKGVTMKKAIGLLVVGVAVFVIAARANAVAEWPGHH